jgi:hypothetical protein
LPRFNGHLKTERKAQRRESKWGRPPPAIHPERAAESFIATFKCEPLNRYSWLTRIDAELAIFDFIEVFYSRGDSFNESVRVSPWVLKKHSGDRRFSKPQSVH